MSLSKGTGRRRADADVIILGAGAAGLACAATVAAAGKRPLVLEARPRVGGRVHTVRERGVGLPVELGAEFVHGRPSELLTIARAAGLSVFETGGEAWHRSGRGLARFAGFDAELAATLGRMRVTRDVSVSEALARSRASRAARATASAFVQGFDAAPPDETSAQWVARAESQSAESARQVMRVANGYDSVIDWLHRAAAGADAAAVRTCVVAQTVEWRPGRVRVTCASPTGARLDTLEAERVVVTLPIGVLQAAPDAPGAVRFDPPLPPRYQRALAHVSMGHALKVTMQFRRSFWPARLGFLLAADQPVHAWWTVQPFDEPRIVGWSTGPRASALLGLGESRFLEQSALCLSRALGVARARVEHELSAWWVHNWSADPFARGAYAFARVGGAMAWRALGAPIRGTVFLAGEATCDAPIAGTVHGAIASGRRAARSVLAARAS